MREITFTLLGDGSSDKVLLSIIDWLIRSKTPNLLLQPQWADFSRLMHPPRTLPARIEQAIDNYPCDWLFIHRDAEKQPIHERKSEIETAWASVSRQHGTQRMVSVVPVRMVEAWLMFDEQAIRQAAGNSNGKERLQLPKWQAIEQLPDPKRELHVLLRKASGLSGRRLQKLNVSRAVQLIAENITDFSPLRNLPAFVEFETSIQTLIEHS